MLSAPTSLDPHLQDEMNTFSVLGNIYEGLTAFDADMQVQPALALRWENPDDLTWRIHLRPGVRFHDGRPLTAADVAFSLNRARSHPKSRVAYYLLAIREIRVLDDLTIELTTERPYPILLNKLRFVLIVPRGSPPEIRHPVGTGPYRLVRSSGGAKLELRAFEGHWRGPAPEAEVQILFGDAANTVTALAAGKVDLLANLPLGDIPLVEAAPCCRVASRTALAVAYLGVLMTRRPLADLRVRRAIDLALDRRALVERLLRGQGNAVGQLVSPQVFGYVSDIEPIERNVEEARRLLAQAGLARGLDVVLETTPGRAAEGEMIGAQLAEVGVRVTVAERSWEDLNTRRSGGQVSFLLGGIASVSGDASDVFDGYLHSRGDARGYGQSNFLRYENPEFDSLVERSGQIAVMGQRQAILQQAMRVAMADLPMIPLWIANRVYAIRREIEWQPRLDGMVYAYEMRRSSDARR